MVDTRRNTCSKENLAAQIADPEQRYLLVESHIRNLLPLQIRAMREDRGWTQTTLAEKIGTTQNAVSRLESPKSNKPTIPTLERLAEAFGVALLVKFVPFSDFVDSVGSMSTKSVVVPSYDKEQEQREKEESERDSDYTDRRLAPQTQGLPKLPIISDTISISGTTSQKVVFIDTKKSDSMAFYRVPESDICARMSYLASSALISQELQHVG